ncbi:MAG: OmpA family protein [Planctomycetes bacterium]|nr:OmpA family protein [Planctomycetota bacterium]
MRMTDGQDLTPQGHEGATPPNDAASMDKLRRLIVGPEQDRLDEIEERMDGGEHQAREVGKVLPQAMRLSLKTDDQIADAMSPMIDRAIHTSVQKNPQPITDAIFPIIGPAIRKAIREAFSNMIESLNSALEHSFSPRSIGWRIEAWRTGKSFAEVVLTHTIVYRVEQVFLIHKETGLLLQHVVADAVAAQDADMVSGMLTAIQDFVRDSFGAGEGESVGTMQVGELTVWVEAGPRAVLAGVMRGNPPAALRQQMIETLEAIHREQGQSLADFSGDAAPFEYSRPKLEALLKEAKQEKEKTGAPVLAVAAIVLLMLVIIVWIALGWYAHHAWNGYIQALRDEPGLVVTEAKREDGRYFVAGLRDPLARDPRSLLGTYGFSEGDVVEDWQPYHALHPALVQKRLLMLLAPPPGVTLTFDKGVATLSGEADSAFVDEARVLARSVPGVIKVDDHDLKVNDAASVTMRRVERMLTPPQTVKLELVGHTIRASGEAPGQWIDRATLLAPLLPGIEAFDTRQLTASDRQQAVFREAYRVLAPPDSVVLDYKDGVITARGKATTQWIEQARMLARSIAGVEVYHDDDVVAADADELLLARARRVLEPPAGVTLAAQSGVVTATGSAPEKWIADAKLLIRAVDGAAAYHDEYLKPSDHAQRLLARANKLLNPPPTVKLALDGDTINASGSATHEWIASARLLARSIDGASGYTDGGVTDTDFADRLVSRATLALRPPPTVKLSVDGQTLKAEGSASRPWIAEARRLAPLIEGVKAYDETGLSDVTTAKFNAARQRIETRTVYFTQNRDLIIEDQERVIGALTNDMRDLLDAAAAMNQKVRIEVTGHTDITDQGESAQKLSQSRADMVVRLLSLAGIEPSVFTTVAAGNSVRLGPQDTEEQKARHRRTTFRVMIVNDGKTQGNP